jgi:DNA-binding transcriptional MerR regulator/methylmalonyl-CoA mutase cobalamin-binding subunit
LPARLTSPGYPIKIAALRSGLTPHIIRAWEKRYGAVCPGRSRTRRRLYSDEEIERLTLLRQATAAGHSIGKVVAESPGTRPRECGKSEAAQQQLADSLDAAFAAVAALDSGALESELHRCLVCHGRCAVMQHVLVPLIHRIGVEWERGEIRVAHEHVASAVIRTLLGNFVRSHSETSSAPHLLVTTPTGQIHELGALLAAATAVDHGWRVTYLGPNLPPEEIAGVYIQNRVDALALSLVYPGDDPSLVNQLRLLRRLLPKEAIILAGGRATADYRAALLEINATVCEDLGKFLCELNRIRRKRAERCCE